MKDEVLQKCVQLAAENLRNYGLKFLSHSEGSLGFPPEASEGDRKQILEEIVEELASRLERPSLF